MWYGGIWLVKMGRKSLGAKGCFVCRDVNEDNPPTNSISHIFISKDEEPPISSLSSDNYGSGSSPLACTNRSNPCLSHSFSTYQSREKFQT